MPLFFPALHGTVPVFNSSCPWASSASDLAELYASPYTSAITTRTATLHGFPDDSSQHQMAFFGAGGESSCNSYGYSPYSLDQYLAWIRPLLRSAAPRKQVIVSITGTLEETGEMLRRLQAFAEEMGVTLGVEFNASCPNIKGHAPPAYNEAELTDYIALLAHHASPTLKIGIKLPPYTFDQQFEAVIRSLLASASRQGGAEHPISFLTCTNTLGQGLVFGEQIVEVENKVAQKGKAKGTFALPPGIGGLAGQAVHQIALGNVYRLSTMLKADPALSSIFLIGVGGVSDFAAVERFQLAGASAVACASALGREGVKVFAKLVPSQSAKFSSSTVIQTTEARL